MKLILSTIVAGVFIYLFGWIFWGIIFGEYFKLHMEHIMRPEHDMKIWAYIVGSLLLAFFMSLIYSKYFRKGNSPFMEGLGFGFMIGFLMVLPHVFYYWAGMPVPYQPVILEGIISGVMYVITGLIIGLIYGKDKAPVAESTG